MPSVPDPQPTVTSSTADEQLFQPSPVLERRTFTHTDPWRVLRIMGEFVEGFDALADVRSAVSIFGSARIDADNPMYRLATETARRVGEAGFGIITGAGPGIMEASNEGAREAGVLSVGLNIELPHEQGTNPYVDRAVHFRYFFVRKTMLVKYSSAFIFFPGGFGTLDELFEALTLKQTGKLHDVPIVLVGVEYWTGLIDWLRGRLASEGKIDPADLDLFVLTDDPATVVTTVVSAARKRRRNGEVEIEPKGAGR
jgi:uncharacterized protein (TIGR00730 family)